MILATAYLLPLFYLTYSLRFGEHAGDNPWNATGLEWTVPSPPPKENFETIPEVRHPPYRYHEDGQSPDHGRALHRAQGGDA